MWLLGEHSSSIMVSEFSYGIETDIICWRAVGKSYVLSPSEKLVAVESVKSLEHPQPSLMHDQKMNHSLDKHAVGAERALSRSFTLLRPVDNDTGTGTSLNVQPTSYFAEVGKVNAMATQHENSLFSSSLSELFSRKCKFFFLSWLVFAHLVCKLPCKFKLCATCQPFPYPDLVSRM